jgi:hypothetical protein
MPAPTDQRRKAVVPPRKIKKDMTLFDYLAECNPPLDKKIIDIALAQNQVPLELRDDAAQEIRLMWTNTHPDAKRFKPGQIAAYAHRIAGHAALRLRRELGAPARLPGSAFRKRKDGSSYVTPGVLSMPLHWDELESWFDTSDNLEASEFVGSIADAFSAPEFTDVSEEDSDSPVAVDEDEEQRALRLEKLEANARKLSRRQYQVMQRLISGEGFDDIQAHLGIKKGVLVREIAVASSLIDC